jgi:hypothetical protein
MTMEVLSGTVGNALAGAGSMLPTSTVTAAPRFQPPGSESESVLPGDVRPRATPVGEVSPRFIAGLGDAGGTLPPAPGSADPGAGHEWVNVNDRPDVSRWSTTPDSHYRDDRQP